MNPRIRHATIAFGAIVVLLGSASCGDLARTGRSPSMLIIDALQAASGASAGNFGGFLNSDVVVVVKQTVNGVQVNVNTIVNDVGKATLRTVLKDLGSPAGEASPTALNQVTIDRYHVQFVRTDGHNIQGVDVPYAFDGAATATITAQG